MRFLCVIPLLLITIATVALSEDDTPVEYGAIKARLINGWNTWNSRNVLSHVLLPEGFTINLALKQHYWIEEKYLAEGLIGRGGENVETFRPGLHSWDGSYTELTIEWEELSAHIQSATVDDDLVVLISPLKESRNAISLIIESGMLWNRPGRLERSGNSIKAVLPARTINVFTTGTHQDDYYVETMCPYLAITLDSTVGICTGRQLSVEEISTIIANARQRLVTAAEQYGKLKDAFLAAQAGIAWNTIYEPKHDRVVSTVGRLWNLEYGGYCLFGWDNFFLAYATCLAGKDLAYANAIEHLRGRTEEGFIPNDNTGNGRKTWDRSQPPVGSIMIREIYRRYPERWFLEYAYERLLSWNRWWPKRRMNGSLLSYGSHPAKNPFNEPARSTKRTAGYESGMDDSPMYADVPFSTETYTLALQDVGLNSLYIADCKALAEIANILGKKKDAEELAAQAELFSTALESLWDNSTGLYLNRRTDTGQLSEKTSPTMFYPLLARVPETARAKRMLKDHFYNPAEFQGEWILPSIARSDPEFHKQRYWKGAIWPPLNFLVYLGLRNYGMADAHEILAQKSLALFLKEWKRKGYVSENYSSISGTGDDVNLSSDRFHSWGVLMALISFVEDGYLAPPEKPLQQNVN